MGNERAGQTDVIDGMKTIFPILRKYIQLEISYLNQRIYQSIRRSFSLTVPGGVFRFINNATTAKTPAVKGRFM
jgi:hypothetical protein